MISDQRRRKPRFMMKSSKSEQQIQVWAEAKKTGGYTIYCGIKGSDVKTYAGAAMSRETLEYNIRKAKMKFGIPLN
tara:strand:+ start:1568 stop:1795 length:228 start_codon:yes stop_codon:yes gene_type:complete